MADLTQVKAGDRVWVGWYQHLRSEGIKTVVRTTPSLLLLDHGGSYQPKYRRDDGFQQGRGSGNHITGIATPEECLQWDQEQAAKRAREDEEWRIRSERAAKAKEMSKLFSSLNVVVGDCHNTKGQEQGLWDVHFHDLSEVAVRALAGIIKSSAEVGAER